MSLPFPVPNILAVRAGFGVEKNPLTVSTLQNKICQLFKLINGNKWQVMVQVCKYNLLHFPYTGKSALPRSFFESNNHTGKEKNSLYYFVINGKNPQSQYIYPKENIKINYFISKPVKCSSDRYAQVSCKMMSGQGMYQRRKNRPISRNNRILVE